MKGRGSIHILGVRKGGEGGRGGRERGGEVVDETSVVGRGGGVEEGKKGGLGECFKKEGEREKRRKKKKMEPE